MKVDEHYIDAKFPPFVMLVVYLELNRLYHAYGGNVPFENEFGSVESLFTMLVENFVYYDRGEKEAKEQMKDILIDGFNEELAISFFDSKYNEKTRIDVPLTKMETVLVSCLIAEFGKTHSGNENQLYEYQKDNISKILCDLADNMKIFENNAQSGD